MRFPTDKAVEAAGGVLPVTTGWPIVRAAVELAMRTDEPQIRYDERQRVFGESSAGELTGDTILRETREQAIKDVIAWLDANDAEVIWGGFSYDAAEEVKKKFLP